MKKIRGWDTFTKVMFFFMIAIGALELVAFIAIGVVFWDTASVADKIGMPILSLVSLGFPALGALYVYTFATDKL